MDLTRKAALLVARALTSTVGGKFSDEADVVTVQMFQDPPYLRIPVYAGFCADEVSDPRVPLLYAHYLIGRAWIIKHTDRDRVTTPEFVRHLQATIDEKYQAVLRPFATP